MLEHLNKISKSIELRGLVTSYLKSAEGATLAWYNEKDERNSISIWFDDFEGVWSSVKDGKVVDSQDFNTVEEFLEFNI